MLSFILTHCISITEELHLQNCTISNKIVHQLVEKINAKRKKAVKVIIYCLL